MLRAAVEAEPVAVQAVAPVLAEQQARARLAAVHLDRAELLLPAA
jgi:hypothetical protein